MIYGVFLVPDDPIENRELAGLYLDRADARAHAASRSRSSRDRFAVLAFRPGPLRDHWACDDLAADGVPDSTWARGWRLPLTHPEEAG